MDSIYVIAAEISGKLNFLSKFAADVPYVFTEVDRECSQDFIKGNHIYCFESIAKAKASLASAKDALFASVEEQLSLTFEKAAQRFPHFGEMKIYEVLSDGACREFKEKIPTCSSYTEMKQWIE